MDAGNTALLIGIIVGLIGSVSVLVGIPIFLLNEEVNRVGDRVESLEVRMDAKFAAQDAMIEDRFAAQDARIDAKFAAQDAMIEDRFAAQAALIEARFATQDAKIEELRRGLSDIDRNLAVLIASLHQAGLVDTAPN